MLPKINIFPSGQFAEARSVLRYLQDISFQCLVTTVTSDAACFAVGGPVSPPPPRQKSIVRVPPAPPSLTRLKAHGGATPGDTALFHARTQQLQLRAWCFVVAFFCFLKALLLLT